MIYLLNIEFEKQGELKHNFYYSILGAFLNLCKDIDNIYKYITKLSFRITENSFFIKVWIHKEENYNKLVNYLIQNTWKQISIDNQTITLKQLNFDFRIFTNNIEYKVFKKFIVYFNSPTYIKTWDINYLLPEPDRFIFSVFEKLKKYYDYNDIDEKDLKKYLKYNVFVWKYDINTQQITIKWNKKAGVRWYITYYVNDDENSDYKKLLYTVLKSARFVWMWTGVKLGCWDVSIKFD